MWGTPGVFTIDAVAAGTASAPGSRSASLFSGGVDSFHVVLHAPFALDAIVFVQGIDMFLADDTRAKAYEPVFRQAANRLGLRAIFVRTNLREHAFFRSVPWERTHGAALAAVGHVLSGEFGRVVIPASSTLDDVGMWGSHWSTDGLWSSGAMTLVHYDPAIHRNEKLLQIAHEPVLWDALRVCWENRAPTGNCSACEKCVKTMVLLEAAGQRSNYTVFDRDVLLARRIRALRVLPPHMIHVWARLLDLDLSPEIKREIERLIARGRRRRWLPALRQRLRRVGFVAAGHAVRRRMRRSEDNHG